MAVGYRFTIADLETFPEDGRRYEVIDGELCVTPAPHFLHQCVVDQVVHALASWWDTTERGWFVSGAEIEFSEDQDVIPDVLWVSEARLPVVFRGDAKLHGAPDLAVEVISPGTASSRRDLDTKLKLYSRQGVQEYWVLDRQSQTARVYRRQQSILQLTATLAAPDELTSPLLPGFSVRVGRFFRLPQGIQP